MSSTRVGINLLWLVPGEVGGSEDYCIGLLRALADHPDQIADLDLTIYVNREVDAAFPDLAHAFPTRRASISGRSRGARILTEHTWLWNAIRRDRQTLVHHMGGTTPLVRGAPALVLVHDLQPWEMPANFSRVKRAYLRATVPTTVRRARGVTTLSRWVQGDVHRRMGVPKERMVCIPPGARRLVGVSDVPIDETAVLTRYDIGERPFFLYPVITYPHKNHEMLVRAFARIAAGHPDALLVLPGGEGPAEDDVRRTIEAEGMSGRVRRLGRVPNGVLEVLYRRTTALTFPSRYEGFGMPVLEVMNEGRPVLASTAGALPEVVGEGGLLLDPDDPTAWSAALDRLLTDRAEWRRLADAATARASTFTWRRTVEDLVSLYHRAAQGPLSGAPRAMNVLVLCPHFAPDVAPTGEVMTRIVTELAARDHGLHVVTALPWYQHHALEPGWDGQLVRTERTPWGRITRVHPFPTDKRNIPARAMAFGGFTALATLVGGAARTKPDVVLAMSPPLTLGPAAWAIARVRRVPFVFNIQDVFPDVAIELGHLTGDRVIAAARWLERTTYRHADAVTVLSDDLAENVRDKIADGDVAPGRSRVHVIPNFVDTEWIRPAPKENSYRDEFGLTGKRVVMYAGNVGLSQALDLMIDAAVDLAEEPDVVFVINGGGVARSDLERRARGLPNVRFVDMQPKSRLPEVLASADVHVVPLRRGLARSSVPSKLYSILAAGRPIVASIDAGTEVARTVEQAGAGLAVPPEDPEAFTKAVRRLLDGAQDRDEMGASGRRFVERWASPAAVAEAYEQLFEALRVQTAHSRG